MTTQSRSFTPSLFAPADTTPSPATPGLIALMFRIARDRLRVWKMRLNDRAYLADLQEFQLSEMGMTHDQRFIEVNKPLWKE